MPNIHQVCDESVSVIALLPSSIIMCISQIMCKLVRHDQSDEVVAADLEQQPPRNDLFVAYTNHAFLLVFFWDVNLNDRTRS